MIWKIRTGYAVVLYGAMGIVAGLVNQKAITLVFSTALSTTLLIVGFCLFGAVLDYLFMSAKLRVVAYRDRLVKLACAKAIAGSLDVNRRQELVECLKNSGERREPVNWAKRPGRTIPLIYYGGTGAICTCAMLILVTVR